MADKLSVTIALEGGKEIQDQLKGIGKAGQQAFQDIQTAAQKVGGFENLKPEQVTAKLKEMGIVGTEALNKINAAVQSARRTESLVGVVQKVESGFASLNSTVALVSGAFGAFAAVPVVQYLYSIISAMNRAGEAISATDAAAIMLGKTFEAYDRQSQGMQRVGVSAKAAADGIQAIAEAAQKVNLDRVTNAMQKLEATSDFKAFQEDQAKAAEAGGRAIPQFGVEAAKQFKLIQDAAAEAGPAGIAARAELEKMGQPIPEGAAKSLKELTAEMGDLAAKMGAAGNSEAIQKSALQSFLAQIDAMPAGLQRTQAVMDSFNNEFGVELVKHLNAGGSAMDLLKEQSSGVTQSMVNDQTRIEESFNRSSAAIQRFKETGDFSNLVTVLEEVGTRASTSFSKVGDELDSLLKKIDDFNTAAGALGQQGSGGGQAPAEVPLFAHGGVVGGSGTGTSDSNLALVSRGEHIMPAAAVRQPGVLSLLESLRVSGGSMRGIGRFATGGVVAMPALAQAGGGIGHLGTVDLRTDHGSVTVMAGASAVNQLSRLAVQKRITSTGRKPGFIT